MKRLTRRFAVLTGFAFALVACGGGGGGGNTPGATVPAAPSGLSASSVSSYAVSLTWTDASTNELGFKVERSTDGTSFTPVASLSANTTSFLDTTLSASTHYWYRVYATSAKGDSARSNTADSITDAAGPSVPAAPSGVTADAVSTTRFNLAWADNSGNEDGFRIERSTAPDSGFAEIGTVAANVVAYSDSGAARGTNYYYRVRAYNGGGASAYSNTATGTALPCTNLCLKQVTCSNPAATTALTGTVYAPNGVDPLPNVTVYVPNGTVQAFSPGAACAACTFSGSPLVSAVTDSGGQFRIEDAPAGTNIPLVMQTGRWRRQGNVSTVSSCVDNAVSTTVTRLPKNRGEGDIPKMAFVTGQNDALECVMRKIGVDDSEFTNPSGSGRINLYVGDGTLPTLPALPAGGAKIDANTPGETVLVDSAFTMANYDMLFFPNKGATITRTAAQLGNLRNYANNGGRVFATRYSYVWLSTNSPFSNTASWNVDQLPTPVDQTAYVDTSFAEGQALAQWLSNVGASSVSGEIPVNRLRHDTDSVVPPSKQWLYINSPSQMVHYTFDTPVGTPASQQCGRVSFNEYLVEAPSGATASGVIFPNECVGGTMSAQEKLLEYMIFYTGACM